MRKARILLVDDYRDALEMWSFYLRASGYEVLTATDGLEAVELANKRHPDVIVLDLDLPGMSGIEAGRRIRRNPATSRIPLIVATGDSHAESLNEARRTGFEAILIKPCDPAALLWYIERSLRRTGDHAAAAGG